jgi:hypothetical protein
MAVTCLLLTWACFLHVVTAAAINSYKTPPCFGDLQKCRNELGHKAIDTLKDKYLLMIGDSLTRYQYTSLVYTLRHRYPPLPSLYPDMNEFTHDGWMPFFKESNAMLSPYEQCDCSYYGGRFFEHRRYHDPHMNISVTYLMYRGFFIEGSNDTNSPWAPEPQDKTAPQWNMGMEQYMLTKFRPQKVDYLVTNVGFFEFHESIPPRSYMQWCRALSDKVIWKTTTAVQHESREMPNEQRPRFNRVDEEMCGTKHVHCLDTSWTVKVDSEKDYFDSIHFREPVYTMLNDQLIDLIRGMHGGASGAEEGAVGRRGLRQHYNNATRS